MVWGRGHCCLSIHLRCRRKSSTMTAHPSDMGVQLSLLEQNQASALSIMHPFCSRRLYSCLLVLQNLAGFSRVDGPFLFCVCPLLTILRKNKPKCCEGVKTTISVYGKTMRTCEERVYMMEGRDRGQGKWQPSSCRPNSFLTQCFCSD